MEVDIFSAAAYGEFETIADLLQNVGTSFDDLFVVVKSH